MAGMTSQRGGGDEKLIARPEVGTGLTIASGLSFLFLCMILPLVGKAGVQTVHYTKNYITFLLVLLITIALSALAVKSKWERSRIDNSPRPKFSFLVLGLSLLLLVALVTGLLKI